MAGCSNGEVGAAPNARAIPANTPRTGAEEMSAAVGAATRADARPAALESRQTRSTQRIPSLWPREGAPDDLKLISPG